MEQDLVISRALVELFSTEEGRESLAFRGGTALHKLFFDRPLRYSEDIDLVQRRAEPIGDVLSAIRRRLDPWLGTPRRKFGEGRATMIYRFETEFAPVEPRRLKIEINTREHFAVYGFNTRRFDVESRWFSGGADVVTYDVDEILATKVRALYQRRKGRDLFDLGMALQNMVDVDPARVIHAYERYMEHGGHGASRSAFESNLDRKLTDVTFRRDVQPLIVSGLNYDPRSAASTVHDRLLALLG